MNKNDSPPSSNCSRRYTVGSARTDAADIAKKSSCKAVMATGYNNQLRGGENSCLKCKIMAMLLQWAHARRSNLSYSNRDKRLKSSRCTPLGSDRCLIVIGRHRRLATRKCYSFNQLKVRDSDRQLLQPMSEDHAARTLPAMADKALSVCVMMNWTELKLKLTTISSCMKLKYALSF